MNTNDLIPEKAIKITPNGFLKVFINNQLTSTHFYHKGDEIIFQKEGYKIYYS